MFAPTLNPGEEASARPSRLRASASVEFGLSPARQPFLYLTCALIAGILLDRWLEPSRWIAATAAIASIVFSIKFVLSRRSLAATFAMLASFVILGALLSEGERASVRDSRLKRLFDERIITPDDPVELAGVMLAPPEPAPQSFYLDLKAESVRVRGEERIATGSARLKISLADGEATSEFDQLALDYGARVRVLVRLERGQSYKNPGSPDFNDFLERRGYDLKGVIKSPLLIEPLSRAPAGSALSWLYHLRLRMMSAIDSRFNARVAGTLKAMLAGNRYFLDAQTSERLRESATFHTLVIAGLHVGIIAWVLLRIPVSPASWGSSRRRSRLERRSVIRAMAAMLILWAYAVMVGLAPPVTRAAVMITVGLIGPVIFRRSASVNTVSLAAFVMLALKPALVADPGFQLSFVAVAGIVFLALPLANTLRRIGEWRPTASTPHPPKCPRMIGALAEAIFWDERKFDLEMRRSPIRYKLHKANVARVLSRVRLQGLVRGAVLLAITSIAIQLWTLPLMALYFNRVSPIGAFLNVIAGLLTAVLMLSGVAAITVAPLSVWAAARLAGLVNVAHYLLANAIVPFSGIPLATFRVAHYEGWCSVVYALYFLPLAMLAVLIDLWRPVDHLFPIDRVASSCKDERETRSDEKYISHLLPACAFDRSRSRSPSRSLLLTCCVALLAGLIAVIRPATAPASGKLTVHFLDVGQGDAALVIFPCGTTMLIDAGGELRFDGRVENEKPGESHAIDGGSAQEMSEEDSQLDFNDNAFSDSAFSVGEAVVSRYLWSQGRTRIDYALATHAHADHIGGLSDVVKNFSIGQAIVGHAPSDDAEFNRFQKAVRQRAITLSAVSAGERFELDGVTVEVLWPPRPSKAPVTSGNDDSIMLRLVYGSISILLAGDIEQPTEEALARSSIDLRADVLKIPHHGSKTSSSGAFLDRVQPRCAVISAGERSRFGHPHAVVVNRYLARGVKLFQTGRDGLVSVETDGTTFDVVTYKQ